MSMLEILTRSVLFPMWMIKDGNGEILKYLHYFDDLEHLSLFQLLSRQKARLKSILISAYENTAYYQQLFDQIGFSPYTVEYPSQVEDIPLLTKDIIRTNSERLIATNQERQTLIRAATGGSTGIPMTFFRDKKCEFLRRGQELFFDGWMGYRLGQKGALFVAAAHFDGTVHRLKAKIRNATCERLLRFDPHNITDQYMDNFAQDFIRYKPRMIKCFPNSLYVFAEFVNRKGIELPPVRVISCTGENLYEHQRRLFQDTFGGEVYEKYGTFECGVIACECRLHKGLHLFTDGTYLEILDNENNPVTPGEMGRVVVTDLLNEGMPLIRYDIGDMAIASSGRSCDCGSSLPLIEKLLGRDRDIIIDSYGNPKPGYLFVHAISRFNLSAQVQIVQVSPNLLKVNVAGPERAQMDLSGVKEKFQEIVGPQISVEFEYVDQIPRDPSGKYSYVVSMLNTKDKDAVSDSR